MSPATFNVRFKPIVYQSPQGCVPDLLAPRDRISRSRSGCKECRKRKVKCDETFPVCQRCQKRGSVCSSTPRSAQWRLEVPAALSSLSPERNPHLLQYWLEVTSQIMVLDPTSYNPFSFPILEHLSTSPALLHTVQSISAGHEKYFPARPPLVCLEERSKALREFRLELAQKPVPDSLSLLTAVLLGWSAGWVDHECREFGQEHLLATHVILDQILEQEEMCADQDPLLSFGLGTFLYWDMCCAHLVPPLQQRAPSAFIPAALEKMRDYNHPVNGYCSEIIYLVGRVHRHCRSAIELGYRDADYEASLEADLVAWSSSQVAEPANGIFEAFRSHGLVTLYRVCYTDPVLITLDDDPEEKELSIRDHAMKTLDHLMQIPITSPLLCLQPLTLLSAAAELTPQDMAMRENVRRRFQGLFSLNRVPANLRALSLLDEVWTLHDSGYHVSWMDLMFQRGLNLVIG
ncbi:fungal-specific transcription factor domain-containing protein [Aspergillus californicus]